MAKNQMMRNINSHPLTTPAIQHHMAAANMMTAQNRVAPADGPHPIGGLPCAVYTSSMHRARYMQCTDREVPHGTAGVRRAGGGGGIKKYVPSQCRIEPRRDYLKHIRYLPEWTSAYCIHNWSISNGRAGDRSQRRRVSCSAWHGTYFTHPKTARRLFGELEGSGGWLRSCHTAHGVRFVVLYFSLVHTYDLGGRRQVKGRGEFR